MAEALPLIIVGLLIAYGGAAELVGWLRARARLRRATAVVVDLHEPGAVSPGGRGRAPVFRFTTDDGRVIDAVSGAWVFPEPRIGARFPITYDPTDPQRTAERPGVRTFKVILSPVLVAFGLGLAAFGLTYL